MIYPVTEHVVRSPRHTTFYLAAGPRDGTPLIFLHGWPELSISWRYQLGCFGDLGFRAIAPDMRGYGRSSVYPVHEDYALEAGVEDMLELLNSIGRSQAVWVGHDWGGLIVWSIASHHPERCFGVANLCVPYLADGFAPRTLLPLIDRRVYPESEYPVGQWDYMLFHEEHFDVARSHYESNIPNTIKTLFRKGSPEGRSRPATTAAHRKRGGPFGAAGQAPEVPRDDDVVGEIEFDMYVAALQRNGFFGPDSWYMNHDRNLAYASRSGNGGRLEMPVLFLHARYDYVCETVDSAFAQPMRRDCADLTEAVVDAGHWMAPEKPVAVNAALARWLATRLPQLWPVTEPPTAASVIPANQTVRQI